MKVYLLVIISSLLTNMTTAQAFESDKNLQYLFSFIKEKSPSNNHVTRFSLGILKYQSSELCIEFDFKVIGNVKSIKPDSIILIADNNSQQALIYPYRDTIHTTANSSVQIATVHFLKPDALDFLKQNPIKAIIVIIDNNQSYINLTRKNRANLREMINSN
jgi:hypothetical protein